MRCVIPSVSKVSLANIILLTLFVGSCFGLSFVLPFALHESHLRLKNCLSQPFFAFQKVAITLNETFRDHTIILFEPHSLRHYWSRNHGAIVASMNQKIFFHGLWARTYFKGFSTSKCCSFQVFILLNVSTFFIVFYNNFKIINTILFFIFTRLQLFNYLSPRELSPNATLQRFQLFGIFFSTFMETFISFQKFSALPYKP